MRNRIWALFQLLWKKKKLSSVPWEAFWCHVGVLCSEAKNKDEHIVMGFTGSSGGKAMWETWVRSLGQEDPLEKEMATQYSCLENSMDGGAW